MSAVFRDWQWIADFGSRVKVPSQSGRGGRVDRIPLVIGVTGHRDPHPAVVSRLRQQVKDFLLEIRASYPRTPLLMLSPLAEGADRIAAYAALDLIRDGADIRLMVPMPMPREIYEEDFGSDSLAEFRALLSQARASIELPLQSDVSPAALRQNPDLRSRQYELLGAFINRQCQILIALWDGTPGLKGGAAEVVRTKLLGAVAARAGSLAALADPSPVCHVTTPRLQADPAASGIVERRMIFPENLEYETDTEAAVFFDTRVFKPLDLFNSETGESYAQPHAVSGALVTTSDFDRLHEASDSRILFGLETHFALADRLAGQHQGRARRAIGMVSALVGLAALGLTMSTIFPGAGGGRRTLKYLWNSIYWVSMFFAVSLYGIARRRDYESRYQDYRALAEALRVQFFWHLARVEADVSDFYLGRQRSDLVWVRNACRAAWLEAQAPAGRITRQTLDLVLKKWAMSQRDYFERRGKQLGRVLARSRAAISATYISGVALGLILSGLALLQHKHWLLGPAAHKTLETWLGHDERWQNATLVLLTAAGMLATLWHNYHERFSSEAQVNEYQRMWKIYRHGCRRVHATLLENDFAAAQHEFFVLGTEALAESAAWISKQREERLDDDPLSVPARGAKLFESAKRWMLRVRRKVSRV